MSRILTAAAFAAAVQASAFAGRPARATRSVTPDATFQSPTVTNGPDLREFLIKRADGNQEVLIGPDNTCGFVNGRPGAPYSCGTDYTCELLSTTVEAISTGYVACCSGAVCGLRATCLDYTQIYSSSLCDNGCFADTFTAKCTATGAPYCGTVTFFDGIMDYYCDSNSFSSNQQLYTTYSGEDTESDGRVWSTYTLTSSSDFTSQTITSSTVSGAAPTQSETSSSSGGSDNSGDGDGDNNNSSGSKQKSNTPVGPIVGGVVGGVAVIALVGLGIFFILRHKKKADPATSTQPMEQNNPMIPPGGGAPGQYPPQQQYAYGQDPYGQSPQPGYYQPTPDQKATGFVGSAPTPDRYDSTSPPSQYTDPRMSTHPHSPTSTLHSNWGQQGQQQGVPGVPPTVHEAGGNAVGSNEANQHHHGQFHELG
ncbi:hypothetical protein F5Y18DRAFT_23865 [Xylariaceae sp. FL1019]|nr:hypothetical protein F5Y18DRAFT_23865 [Xylariaceae sp. FL1019]